MSLLKIFAIFRSKKKYLLFPVRNFSVPGDYTDATEKLTMPLMSSRVGHGVIMENESADISELVENFTAPALARALRDREDMLQLCAQLIVDRDYSTLGETLRPFLKANVTKRRSKTLSFDPLQGFNRQILAVLQRHLHRMPREVFQAARRRASVVIPLCNVRGEASMLLTVRSENVGSHKSEICFPGGMVDEVDSNIIHTSLREMREEISIPPESVDVLGVLRCNWLEVANLTGVAVTPVVGYVGDIEKQTISRNHEVEEYFTVPLRTLLNDNNWEVKEFASPVFRNDNRVVWGLTGYLLRKFLVEVVSKCNIVK